MERFYEVEVVVFKVQEPIFEVEDLLSQVQEPFFKVEGLASEAEEGVAKVGGGITRLDGLFLPPSFPAERQRVETLFAQLIRTFPWEPKKIIQRTCF